MRRDELRLLLRAETFRPFTIYTEGGRIVPIHHHDFGLLSPDGRTLWAYAPNMSCEMVDVTLITSIDLGVPPVEAKIATVEGPSAA